MHVILGFVEARWSKLRKGYLWLNFDALPIRLIVVQTKTTSVFTVCIYRLETENWLCILYRTVGITVLRQVEEKYTPFLN